MSEMNRKLRNGKYLPSRRCNTCYNNVCRFSFAKSVLVRALTKLGIDDDKIIEILKDEWKRIFKMEPEWHQSNQINIQDQTKIEETD